MKLLLRSSNGNERIIAEISSLDEANIEIDKFLEEHNYISYYRRLWNESDNRMVIDVGSWSEFFVLEREEVE